VNDFLSGRSPLTLALRVGDHMMFVQLQLAAQQNSGQLQHRHVIASRGEQAGGAAATTPVPAAGPAASSCRTLPGSTPTSSPTFARLPTAPACPPSPVPSPAASPSPMQNMPLYCTTANPTPVTAGMFHSHGTSAQTVNGGGSGSVMSSCSEVSPGVLCRVLKQTRVEHVDCASRSKSSPSSSPTQASRTRKHGAILNDLLSATRHYQGMPQSLTQLRCQTQCSLSTPSLDLNNHTTSERTAAAANQPLHLGVQCPSQAATCKPT
ncbi:hypothetical protein E2320_021992, partial [Naja naja]